MSDSDSQKENIFKELVPAAKRVLYQQMTGTNSKIAVQVAESVLDRAGEAKQNSREVRTPIVITNSQVAILSDVANEVEAKIANDNLYVPDSKELESGKNE